MARQFIYTITTGRSGTAYLAKLLRQNLQDAETHHERATFDGLGINSPDASHFVRFNTVGITKEISAFWKRKLELDAASPRAIYAEASHMLFKAGLIEHLNVLGNSRIDLITLRRPETDIAWSYFNRFEFTNYGYTWLFALDPRYPKVIVPSEPYAAHGAMGYALWYVREVFARAAYYAEALKKDERVHLHRVTLDRITKADGAKELLNALGMEGDALLPARTNASKGWVFPPSYRERLDRIAAELAFDADEAGAAFHFSGMRLG